MAKLSDEKKLFGSSIAIASGRASMGGKIMEKLNFSEGKLDASNYLMFYYDDFKPSIKKYNC